MNSSPISSSGQNDQCAAIPKTFPRLPTWPNCYICPNPNLLQRSEIWIYCRNLKSKFKWSITWWGGSCIERFIPVIRPRPCLCTIIQPTAFHWTVAIFCTSFCISLNIFTVLGNVANYLHIGLHFAELLLIICTLVWILLNFILHFTELLLEICTLVCISLNFILQCSELHFISVHFNESEAVSAHSQ